MYIVLSDVSVVSILDVEQVSTLLSVVGTTEENINFLERNGLGLRYKEPDKEDQKDVSRHEEEECFSIRMLEISDGLKWEDTYGPQLL